MNKISLLLMLLVGCSNANIDKSTYKNKINCEAYGAPRGLIFKCQIGQDICYLLNNKGISCFKGGR